MRFLVCLPFSSGLIEHLSVRNGKKLLNLITDVNKTIVSRLRSRLSSTKRNINYVTCIRSRLILPLLSSDISGKHGMQFGWTFPTTDETTTLLEEDGFWSVVSPKVSDLVLSGFSLPGLSLVLCCVVLYCSVLWYGVVCCVAVWCGVVCCVVLCCVV